MPPFVFLAEHPALDLLNTVVLLDGTRTDLLRTDEDVVTWLRGAGLLDAGPVPAAATKGLLATTRELRARVHELVTRRKAGKRPESLEGLNAFLAAGGQRRELVAEGGELRLATRFGRASPGELLLPVALAAAELVAEGDLELVRTCESEDCVLVFYDRTRSHRRRWCSMATCGNRHKVRSFRARQHGE